MKKIILLASIFLLSSCMKIDGVMELGADGKANSRVAIDMSKFMTLMEAFGTGTEVKSLSKNLCLDENFSGGLSEGMGKSTTKLENFQCSSLGDYKAEIRGTIDYTNKKGIQYLSGGVILIDLITIGGESSKTMNRDNIGEGTKEAADMGFSMTQKYVFPGKISHADIGTVSDGNMLSLNLLDPNVLRRRSIFVVITPDGKMLTKSEIYAYKLMLKKHNRTAKK